MALLADRMGRKPLRVGDSEQSRSRADAFPVDAAGALPVDGQLGTKNDPKDQPRPSVANDDLASRQSVQIPCAAVGGFFAAADAVAVVVASLFGAGGYQLLLSGVPFNLDLHIGAGLAAATLYILIGRSSGFYQVDALFSPRRNTRDIVWYWFLTSLLLAFLAFLFRIGVEFSRGSIMCFSILALPLLFASRDLMKMALASAVRHGRVQGRRVVTVGLRNELPALSQMDLLRRFGLTEVGRIELPSSGNWSLAANKSILALLDRALELARLGGAEEIVLAVSWTDARSIDLIRERFRNSPLPVQLLPDHKIRSLTSNPAFSLRRSFAIEVQRAPLSRLEQSAKRLLDILGAGIGLVLLSPLCVLTAVAIKLETRGPVFFLQKRTGFNGNLFTIFKFRTMTVMENGAEVVQATRNDPRITTLGGLLRATSIDELPQLLNVLLGNMSLVGPRPHAIAHDGYYGSLLSDYAFRHHVKPGITGWAQIHGCRGETAEVASMKKRLDFDLWYISNWSLGLDLLIIFRTVTEVIRRRNAY
ncbi:undecaprenyl-phosphate glucose phosphotransferase [Bradyrhizobium sp. 76]|uniref:undecaprenyl-phosphate glucose phosphotransferase n=1 Tax=Bradyrhizobium sp. 76 TaxID=2782680 RepID=UPI001FFA5747|nr:undecaprenyl-phosphate glucose phosphotransferase [Bradyrhizobium sp. 76]MCK1404950.1 undecaprenyl-phosphate glucose phosphotransferase [Bradyrhizobium sp. 76]